MGRRPAGVARVGAGAIAAAACLLAGCGGSGTSSAGETAARTATGPHAQRSAANRVVVPRLVGERFGAAVRAVSAAGLHQSAPGFPGSIGNPTFNGHCQQVVSQSPRAGTSLPRGSTVSIVYAICPRSVTHGHPYTTASGGRRSR